MKLSKVEQFILRLAMDAPLVCDVFMADYYRDNGLSADAGSTWRFCLCNAEPDTYTEAITTFNIGNKNSPTLSTVDAAGGGRARQITGFADGVIAADDDASHWAVVDVTNTRLHSSGALTAPQAVTTANPFTIPTSQFAAIGDAEAA